MFPLGPSLRIAVRVVTLAAFAGIWLGYLLRNRPWAAAAATLPLLLPPTVLCAYLFFPHFDLTTAIWAAMLFAIPYLAFSSRAAFAAVDPAYGNAARSLGASPWRVFWQVELPLAYRPILTAAVIAFGRVTTETAATLLV